MTELQLRPYQEEAIEAWMKVGHGTLAFAPGAGKTLTAIRIIKRLRKENPMHRTLVLVPTLVLKDQWEHVLAREDELAKIVTYQWAAPRAESGEFWRQWDLIIADESHHLAIGETFRQLLIPIYKAQYGLGLTATPPQPVDGEENLSLRVLPVVYTYTFSQGREQGFTADIEIRPIPVQLAPDERERYTELTNMIKEMMARYGESYQNKPYGKDALTGKTIWGGTITNERRQLVALAEEKYERLAEIIAKELLLAGTQPTDTGMGVMSRIFVWSEYVFALEKAKEVLNRGGQVAELVTGETPKKERKRIIEEAWGRDFPVLLVARVGEEGLDAPESAVGVVLAAAKTSRQTVQRLGRLLRPFPGKKARLFAIFAERTTDEKIIPLLDLVTE